MVEIKSRDGFAPILIIIVVAVLAIGGVGIGLAWKTGVLDKSLPPNVKEFFGKEITPTDGEQTDGEQPATNGKQTNGKEPTNGEETPPAEDPTKDWKVYKSPTYGYTVKYPQNWTWRSGTPAEGLDFVITSVQGGMVDVELYNNIYGSLEAWLKGEFPGASFPESSTKRTISGRLAYEDLGDGEGGTVFVDFPQSQVLQIRYTCFGLCPGGTEEKHRDVYELMVGTLVVP